MAKMFGVGKKAQKAAEQMNSFDLIVPEADSGLVKSGSTKDGGINHRWTELVTVLAADAEDVVGKKDSVERTKFTVALKVSADEDSINKGKRVWARWSVNWATINSDEPTFGDKLFTAAISSLLPIMGYDLAEDGSIPVEALAAMFPDKKEKAEVSTLIGTRLRANILDKNDWDTEARKITEKRRQNVETFLPE
jgi:hypothetical protein